MIITSLLFEPSWNAFMGLFYYMRRSISWVVLLLAGLPKACIRPYTANKNPEKLGSLENRKT